MRRYLAILGRKPDLAVAELHTVIEREKSTPPILTRLDHLLVIESARRLDCSSYMRVLGGTIKLAILSHPQTSKTYVDRIITILKNESIGKTKLVFGISVIDKRGMEQKLLLPKLVKERLSEDGIASRYVLPAAGTELTSAQVALHHLVELYVFWRKGNVEIARTEAIQDFKGYATRDYQRPYADPKEGMLPPKVARMMVNLAFTDNPTRRSWILDPFCGTGTIAMEATTLGISSISSDIKREKVEGTTRNLVWVSRMSPKTQWQVLLTDATRITSVLERKVDAIVTEPYLGPRFIKVEKLNGIIKGLNKLYLGSLKEWKKMLNPGSRVVMVLPEFWVHGFVKMADLVIDRCEKLGYTLVAGPFEYERPGATVRRKIVVFERMKKE